MTTVAEEIRQRRTRLGLSQLALATRAGVYRDSISNMEVGKSKNPHRHTLDSVRKALDEVEAERGLAPLAPLTPSEAAPPSPGTIRVTVAFSGDKSIAIDAAVAHLPEVTRLVDRILDTLATQAQAGLPE